MFIMQINYFFCIIFALSLFIYLRASDTFWPKTSWSLRAFVFRLDIVSLVTAFLSAATPKKKKKDCYVCTEETTVRESYHKGSLEPEVTAHQ